MFRTISSKGGRAIPHAFTAEELRNFFSACDEIEDMPYTNAKLNNIAEWQAWLRNMRKCSAESCNARLASLKSFLKYLSVRDLKYRHLYLESLNIRRQKESKRKVVGTSEIAVKSLLQEPDIYTTTGYRDVMFMSIL